MREGADERSPQFLTGLEVRREVLGDEYVQRSLDSANEFTEPLQALITEYCWGAVWGRDILERSTRSLINIAMLTALGRQDELRLHVRGALRNGCTKEQIRETLLQTAVYCGVPAALAATRTAQEVISELAEES